MGSVLFTSDNLYDYGNDEIKELSKILKIRDAEIISAEYDNDILTLKFTVDNKKYIKKYEM
jgi:alpha-galactosidase